MRQEYTYVNGEAEFGLEPNGVYDGDMYEEFGGIWTRGDCAPDALDGKLIAVWLPGDSDAKVLAASWFRGTEKLVDEDRRFKEIMKAACQKEFNTSGHQLGFDCFCGNEMWVKASGPGVCVDCG